MELDDFCDAFFAHLCKKSSKIVLLDRSALQYSVQKLESVTPFPLDEIKIRAPNLSQVILHSLAFTIVYSVQYFMKTVITVHTWSDLLLRSLLIPYVRLSR
jgi:hypothetical protein